MFSPKHLLVVALLLAVSNLHFEALADDPLGGVKPPQNVSKCDTSCQQPAPPYGDPGYVAPPLSPPPPPPSPPPTGYSIYSAPPPPHKSSQSKCPPAPGAPTPPYYSYYGPPSNNYGPPSPYYAYSPPGVYTPVPYGQGTRSASQILPILAPVMMLFSSFICFLKI